jgi:hypothetical protein
MPENDLDLNKRPILDERVSGTNYRPFETKKNPDEGYSLITIAEWTNS